MDWLLPIGLFIITMGIVKSVHEEWDARGLTDTSFSSLFLWLWGSITLAAWGFVKQDLLLGLVTVLPSILYTYWIGHKIHMTVRTHAPWLLNLAKHHWTKK